MATYTINVGPYETIGLLRQSLAAPSVGMLLRTDQGWIDAPGYTVLVADGWRSDNTGVEGNYCTVIIDDDKATDAKAAIAALGDKKLPDGNEPNRVLGLSSVAPDGMRGRIERRMDQRLFSFGFSIGNGAAKRWYSSKPEYLALYALWNSLAARLTDVEFDALGLRVEHLDDRTTTVTRTLAQTIAVAAARNGDAYRTRARVAIAAWTADPEKFKFNAIDWPLGYGETA